MDIRKTGKMQMRVAVGLAALACASAVAAKNWGEWSAPQSIEAMPGASSLLNTAAVDGCSSMSHDGLELYFTSSRAGSMAVDIWVARRSSTSEGFGAPENLGAPVNSPAVDFCPTIRPGKRLYFSSTRHDGAGDLYVSRLGKDGWSTPENLGPNINSPSVEESASFYEDEEGREVMLFSSRRSGRGQIYQSIDGGPAQLVAGGRQQQRGRPAAGRPQGWARDLLGFNALRRARQFRPVDRDPLVDVGAVGDGRAPPVAEQRRPSGGGLHARL